MSVDLGKARTGIAVCDKTEFLASPYTVIFEKSPKQLLEKVSNTAKETKAGSAERPCRPAAERGNRRAGRDGRAGAAYRQFPRAAKFGNASKLAHAGLRVTISPETASLCAAATASSIFLTLTISGSPL